MKQNNHLLTPPHVLSGMAPDTTILLLKYFYCRTSKDIAKQVHMTPAAVRVRLNRALKKLRKLLTNDGNSGKRGDIPHETE